MSGVDGWTYSVRAAGSFTGTLAPVIQAGGAALAHSGHAHDAGGGKPLAAVVVLLGSVLLVATSAYLDRTGRLPGPHYRAGVLLGILGLALGVLLAV